ncbi:MAG: polysaccharide deacetylase family protein [Clostridiaceae bacterium]|nr:polysaccharide deacetylase family protein [Clostridiaceae bacterium]
MLLKKLSLCLTLFLVLSGCSASSSIKTNKNEPSNYNSTISNNFNTSNGTKPTKNAPNLIPNFPQVQPYIPTIADPVLPNKPFTPVEISNTLELQTKKISWSWKYSPKDTSALLSKYHGYAFGDTSSKVIYLTFDEGYENGYTASILDTLKANNVQAAFFVTDTYVTGEFKGRKNLDLLKRMSNEGHLICNHSIHHQSMPSYIDETIFNKELIGVETRVDNIPGLKMSKFFRPPMGDFSELSLYYTQKLGYKSIFFGLAYNDWDPKNQPDPETSKKNLLKDTKPGIICLLHPESKTNDTILDALIKEWTSLGYKFKTLKELP